MNKLFNIKCYNNTLEIGGKQFEIDGITNSDIEFLHCGKFNTPEGFRVSQIVCDGIVFDPYSVQNEDGFWETYVTGYTLIEWISNTSNTSPIEYIVKNGETFLWNPKNE